MEAVLPSWEAICHHCGEDKDKAQHTLEFCPAWELPRYILCLVIGERFAPIGDRAGESKRATGVRGCPLLLRASYAGKAAGRKEEREKEKLSLL